MNLSQQLEHEANVAKLDAAIARTLVHPVAVETTAEGDVIDVFMVVLDDRQIGLLKHGVSREAGRPTDRPVWQYKFADKGYWGRSNSRKDAVNSVVHRALFA